MQFVFVPQSDVYASIALFVTLYDVSVVVVTTTRCQARSSMLSRITCLSLSVPNVGQHGGRRHDDERGGGGGGDMFASVFASFR